MPINRRSMIMFDASGTDMNKYGTEIKGDAYYGYSDGYHTLQVTYAEFVGRFRIQCTLSLEPTSTDWFDLVPDTTIYGSLTDQAVAYNPDGYIQFNCNDPSNLADCYTFTVNYTFVRCYMDRKHVVYISTYDSSYGQIRQVILSA